MNNKALGVGLLVAGGLLLLLGINESQSTASEISKILRNSPTDRSIWFFVGGGVALIVGLYMVLARRA